MPACAPLPLLLAALAPAPPQQAAPAALAYFDGPLAAAQRQAAERNVPLVVFAAIEGEEASERFADDLLEARSLARALGPAVVLVVNNGAHQEVERRVEGPDGEERTVRVCEDYGTPGCEAHRRNWDAVYRAYVEGPLEGAWRLPEAVVARPDGELHGRVAHGQPPAESEILALVEAAREAAGRGLDAEQYAALLPLVARARAATADPAARYAAWEAALVIVTVGPLAEEGRAARDAALETLEGAVADARARLTPEGVADAYRELARLLRVVKDTPLAGTVRNLLVKAERDKDLREAVAELKRELEAEELLAEAEALLAAGDERKARRLLRKLVGKRYAETPSAARARELLGDE